MNGFPKEQATFARVSGYVEQVTDLSTSRHTITSS